MNAEHGDETLAMHPMKHCKLMHAQFNDERPNRELWDGALVPMMGKDEMEARGHTHPPINLDALLLKLCCHDEPARLELFH